MSAYRALRLGFFAALLLLVGAGRLAAADSYPFEIRLNSSLFGEKVFTGEIAPEGGSFEMFVTSGSTRIHMTGSIAGDHVHVYGELDHSGFGHLAAIPAVFGRRDVWERRHGRSNRSSAYPFQRHAGARLDHDQAAGHRHRRCAGRARRTGRCSAIQPSRRHRRLP